MKLKQRPNDFRVEELLRSDYLLGRGAYRVYRVTKRKRTSSEAAAMLGDLAGVPASRVAMAGLKDRQGVTQQYMTIEKGKRVSHRDELLGIETVGFAECELTSEDSEGNAFSIVVRDVRDAELERLRAATPLVREHGLPNYFDEQRFGNLRHKQGWIARDLARGEAELALRRLLTSVSDFDDDRWRSFKSGVYRSWGDWRRCRDLAGRFGRHHSIFEHLRREPDDFAGAFRYVATRERLIHLFAWQSHLWNRAVVLHLERALRPPDRETIRSLEGRLAFPKEALPSPPEWNGSFPLIGPHARGVEHADQRELYREVVEHEGLGLDELSIDGVPGFALKAEERALVVRPHELRVRPSEPDKLNTRRKSVQLRFSLPRGAYATLVVRRLFAGERASGASPGATSYPVAEPRFPSRRVPMPSELMVGVIGGSGLYDLDGLSDLEERSLSTPFGAPSDAYLTGNLDGIPVAFLPRHGRGHRISPSEINFRANLWGLKALGVTHILSVSAVGSLREEIVPGHFVIIDQFIDRTRHRADTFFGDGVVAHVMFADPICSEVRAVLLEAARTEGITAHDGGTYVNMEGPQFSTRAESHLYRSWNADVIGMTNLQEAKLAREAEMHYATVAMSTDYDCWHEAHDDVTVDAILETMAQNIGNARKLVARAIPALGARTYDCPCADALAPAILTHRDAISKEARTRLGLLLDRYLT